MPPKNKTAEDSEFEPQCKRSRPELENEEDLKIADESLPKKADNGSTEENSVSEQTSEAESGTKKVCLVYCK